jgi:predicted transcriptional regulator
MATSASFIRQACESGVNISTHDLDGRIRSMAISNSLELAAELVAAYVSNNPVPSSELPDLILAVHSSLEKLGSEPEPALPQAEAKAPAVPIRKSVTPDYLICLEDGKRFRTYPMVAPSYSVQRSALARKIGFGQKRKAG